jgi:hypothetical protein
MTAESITLPLPEPARIRLGSNTPSRIFALGKAALLDVPLLGLLSPGSALAGIAARDTDRLRRIP